MSEQPPSTIGTVAQEAARLIEDMATMARTTSSRGDEPGPHADNTVWPNTADQTSPAADDWVPAPAPAGPEQGAPAPGAAAHGYGEAGPRPKGSVPGDSPPEEACSQCGAEHGGAPGEGTAANCKLCPLCRGIGLLRSVRPETVDLLADLAMSLAATLRDVALRSRASDPSHAARSGGAGSPDPNRAPVQDIPVDDESEG